MARENFALTLTKINGKDKEPTQVYVLISSIMYFEETSMGTVIKLGDTSQVIVQEKVKDIERQGAAYGVLKVVNK